MAEYLTPGVYVEEVSFRAPSIEGVGTSTAAFAGATLTGPIGQTPVLLTSFGDFQNIYGGYGNLQLESNTSDPKNINYLALSVKAFFDNGGSQLYVSRVFVPQSATNTGVASSGTPSASTVVVTARFPGSYANQVVKVALKATKTQQVSGLPPGSLLALVPAGAASIASVQAAVAVADTQITVTPALAAAAPPFIAIDSELLAVTATDATNTKLTVTRGISGTTAALHSAGAQVYPSVATVQTALVAGDTTLTTSAPLTGILPAGSAPQFLQIDEEVVGVTTVDASGTSFTITRGAKGTTAAAHAANAPVFAPVTSSLYTNGATGTFTSGGSPLPTSLTGAYLLTATVTAQGASGAPQVYDGLGFDPAHPNYLGTALGATPPRHIDALENQVAFTIGSSLTPTTLYQALFGGSGSPLSNTACTFTLSNGNDGLEPESTDFANALAYFTALEDVAIVAAPGSGIFADSHNIINALITHVSQQRAYRFAVLETPPNQIAQDNEDVRAQIDSSYAALYVPWVITPNPLARSGVMSIPAEVAVPPSGYIAGIFARNDEQNGVAKAPANEVVLGASRFERTISFGEQGLLNPLGINCLRYFPNRGYRLWGARTTSSDTEFMYVNVRRYLIYLEHSIDNSTQWAVFENNGPALWARVKESIDSFLYNEWKEGSLLGDSAAQAFFVRCDRTTMTQNDLDNGRMICLIGVALLKPAEFVIFRIGQKTADAQA
jgi:phage tail sheath protein FI